MAMFRSACACAGATMKSSTDAAAASSTSLLHRVSTHRRLLVVLALGPDSDALSLPQTSSMILSAAFSAAAAGKYTLIVTQADRGQAARDQSSTKHGATS